MNASGTRSHLETSTTQPKCEYLNKRLKKKNKKNTSAEVLAKQQSSLAFGQETTFMSKQRQRGLLFLRWPNGPTD